MMWFSRFFFLALLSSLALLFCGCPPRPVGPAADFAADVTSGEAPLSVQFTDMSTPGDAAITSWAWSFGDGGQSNEQDPRHGYAIPGVYTVSLTVTTAHGSNTKTRSNYITVTAVIVEPSSEVDLTRTLVVVRPTGRPKAEQKAAAVLVEEVQKRTGILWPVTTTWPQSGPVIAITSGPDDPGWGRIVPRRQGADLPELRPEGYRLHVETGRAGSPVVWIVGADGRGALYGVGKFLRTMNWAWASVTLPVSLDIATAPAYPMRGHQLGYRNTANSYDAWDADQYEQYIRELAIFGANCIENIPFDASDSPHFQVSKDAMAQILSAICQEYDLDYWIWTPADFDVANATRRAEELLRHQYLYQNCVRLNGVFVPGGDPGSNTVENLMPYLQELAALLARHHPEAGVWVSNQGFEHAANDVFFNYLQTHQPDWLAGVVFGPWTKISLEQERTRTPAKYPIRHYPDITHSVRCQYPVPNWDRAFAHTLGREGSNPRPLAMAQIHNLLAPFTCGFVAYSDGCHDDVNKIVWLQCGWDPATNVRDGLIEYARFFFGTNRTFDAADAILALEQNWAGSLAKSTAVETTLQTWVRLENGAPELADNWRWQLCLLRAYYDAYTRRRLLYETTLENQANAMLAQASGIGSAVAMQAALAALAQASTSPAPELRTRIRQLCAALFSSIGLQTSVALYQASGAERGCVLDFVDHPLNNRWWLEDQFAAIAVLPNESARLAALDSILTWENPVPGGFYDDLGNASKQPHLVIQKPWDEDPGYVASTQCEFTWNAWRQRLSWQDQGQTLFGTPLEMRYDGLDPSATYRLRVMYTGRFRPTMTLTANGMYAIHGAMTTPSPPQTLELDIPREATASGVLQLRWDLVAQRGCQVGEVWLFRR